ncbi:MAG: YaiI/YqxD family protein [Bacillota bacterium]
MIYVDADSCPVTDEVIDLASKQDLPVTLVKSYAHFSLKPLGDRVDVVYVDQEKEASDYRIMRLIKTNDVLITADYGLASLALAKTPHIIHPRGTLYKKETMDQLLQSRYLSSQVRKAGGRMKGPKAFTESDRAQFIDRFSRLLNRL